MDLSNTIFTLNTLTVDPACNEITLNGQTKRIEPQIIQLLCYLAEHAECVVDREALMNAVWPEVVVAKETVNRAIFALRLAIGDDAGAPKYIETIPKKGYRLLVKPVLVNPVSHTIENTLHQTPTPAVVKIKLNVLIPWVLLAITLSLVLVENEEEIEILKDVPVDQMEPTAER